MLLTRRPYCAPPPPQKQSRVIADYYENEPTSVFFVETIFCLKFTNI